MASSVIAAVPTVLVFANFIFYDPGHPMKWSLNILTRPEWQPGTVRQVFEGATELNMNLMKVFLPVAELLPDPRGVDLCSLHGCRQAAVDGRDGPRRL